MGHVAIKVLLVTNDFPPTLGGIQTFLHDLVSVLPADDIVVFTSTQDAAAAAEFDAQAPYPIVRIPSRIMLPTPRVRAQMVQLIRKHNIDVVWFGAAAPLGLLAGAAKTAHGDDPSGNVRVISSTHGHEIWWATLPGVRRLYRKIVAGADVLTYISDYTKQRLIVPGSEKRWHRLTSGVNTQLFQPIDAQQRAEIRQQWGIAADAPVIVCISRLVRRKGQDKLIAAMPHIQQQFPQAQLLLIGRGSLERTLRKQAADNAAIRLLGGLDNTAMRELLAASDVFAMPCRTRHLGFDVEGLGLVFLEAQACGVPVVAGDSGGAPETVDATSGVIVNGCDPEAIAAAVVEMLRQPPTGMRANAQRWARTVMGKRLAALIEGKDVQTP